MALSKQQNKNPYGVILETPKGFFKTTTTKPLWGYFLGYKIRTTTTPQKRMVFNTYKENSSEAYRANVLTLNEILCENAKT